MTRIVLEALAASGERGLQYRVWHAGAVLVPRTWNPEYDAARSLKAGGFTGTVEVWRQGGTHPDVIMDIERAAGLTVEESAGRDIRVVRWRPRPSVEGEPQTAVLRPEVVG